MSSFDISGNDVFQTVQEQVMPEFNQQAVNTLHLLTALCWLASASMRA